MSAHSVGRRLRGWLFVLLSAGWVVTAVPAVAVVALFHDDSAWCEHETGDSDFGEASWSWWPVGVECRWTEPRNLVTDRDTPSWGLTGVAGLYLGVGMLLVREARMRKARRATGPPEQFASTPRSAPRV